MAHMSLEEAILGDCDIGRWEIGLKKDHWGWREDGSFSPQLRNLGFILLATRSRGRGEMDFLGN